MTGQNSAQAGGKTKRYRKSIDAPSPTVTGQVRSWTFAGAGATAASTSKQRRRGLDEPAHTITGSDSAAWVAEGWEADVPRPDETGDDGSRGGKLTDRSHHGPGEQGRRSTNVTPREAATLQTYPLDFEFAGGKGDQCQQIGNAVPPLLAEVLLQAMWEKPAADPWADVFDLAHLGTVA